MRVVFRVDASLVIGTGHVMRCLCLAEALSRRGAECIFICRRLDGGLIENIETMGYTCYSLPAPNDMQDEAEGYASWLGVPVSVDAEQTRTVLDALAPEWLIVDHYALDAAWEQTAKPEATKLFVLDDLADRPHICDLLLDQSFGRATDNYDGLVPKGSRILTGSDYALLRPEFLRMRPESLVRDRKWPPERILVSMGGVDPDNATAAVLDVLDGADLPVGSCVTVVMGGAAPWLDVVRVKAEAISVPTEVVCDVSDMADCMASSDLAIGAAGTTAMERCSLGLPSLILVLADNQKFIAQALDAQGAACSVGDIRDADWQKRMDAALGKLTYPGALAKMSAAAAKVTDARGLMRVLRWMLGPILSVRHCTERDARDVWLWREFGGAARLYRSGREIPWGDHESWFASAIDDSRHVMLMISHAGVPVAHVRLDHISDLPEKLSVSICLAPNWRKFGLARPSLLAALTYAVNAGTTRVIAEVHEDNKASIRLFQSAGFIETTPDGLFRQFSQDIATLTHEA